MKGGVWRALVFLAAASVAGCLRSHSAGRAAKGGVPFTDVTAAAGIAFRHETGGDPPLNILQTAGAGCAFLDYDRDGDLDLFFVNGRRLEAPPGAGPRHALYRNNGDGTFTDVSVAAGIGGGYGMGVAVGDADGDGWPDLYVTHYGANALYRNNRDGTFTDIAARAGVTVGGWSTAAAWGDYDGDGDLDLFVGRYLAFGPGSGAPRLCEMNGVRIACPPRYYAGQDARLYRNDGDGTFTDVSRATGVRNPQGKTLGALWWDPDEDGRLDLFVANDGVANSFYRNLGRGRFREEGLTTGLAFGANGNAEASMGVAAGDYDRDGDLDLYVTNFQNETDALYRNDGGLFEYATAHARLADATLPFLSFGVAFLDYDNDSHLDLAIASGHVQDAIQGIDPACTFAQPRQLHRNRGDGTFDPVGPTAGPAFTQPAVGRGLAVGDYDNDGDLDLAIHNNGGAAMLLRNEVGNRQAWVRLRLEGRAPNPLAIGARVTVNGLRSGTQLAEIAGGSSYASTHDFRVHFGLGDESEPVTVTVRWPDGRVSVHRNVPLRRESVLRHPAGG